MQKFYLRYIIPQKSISKLSLIMKLSTLLSVIFLLQTGATTVYSQKAKVNINAQHAKLSDVLEQVEHQTDYLFFYNKKNIDVDKEVNMSVVNTPVSDVLDKTLGNDISYLMVNDHIILSKKDNDGLSQLILQQGIPVTGTITDISGEPMPGVNVVLKGTSTGVVTDSNGKYRINIPDKDAVLVFSFLGYTPQEIIVGDRINIDISLQEDTQELEEVVVIGYGTMKKRDLTGAITSIDMNASGTQPDISIIQSLQGAVAGLNVGQVNEAGGEPGLTIRGRTSLSGVQNPLVVLDGVIFRGNLIDLNPSDIQSIDILKDNSAAAVYGSQAANGVVIVTTKRKSRTRTDRPTINYSAKYSFQSPIKELKPGGTKHFVEKITEHKWKESRTAESGYIDPKSTWDVTSFFKTNEQKANYLAGMDTDWYRLLTNDNMYANNHNISIANQGNFANYFISAGYTGQKGHMINEEYERLNLRINIDSKITDWLSIGTQAFMSASDYSGQPPPLASRYTIPIEADYYDGKINPLIENYYVSPLANAQADDKDIRQTLFGNIYATVDIPFIKGLSYSINVANNQIQKRRYVFRQYENNFQGYGEKRHEISNDLSMDNNVTFKRSFNNIHNFEATLVYGMEKRKHDYTKASSSVFINDVLGYNKLSFGSSELQAAESGAWEEASIFTMFRIFYNLKNRYLFTGTFRRDGFSGFSEDNKFGYFPSGSIGWVLSEEPFMKKYTNVLNYLKLRASYGSSGNRTIGRYDTLAKVNGGYNYVDASGASIYTMYISSLESSSLKWETTTGINIGVDYGFLKSRINGSINYYNNNTKNLLYTVDLPSIGRYSKFPDNLGRIHNKGIEISVSANIIQRKNFTWRSDFVISRNRDELKELLGADADGDGKEDDLVSEGLFIGHSLNTIYDYQITGEKYQLGEDVPFGFDFGSYKIVDQVPDDGPINATTDKVILGYEDPSYRFSINNQFTYKNWSLSFFINSIQGGKDYYFKYNDAYDLQYGDQFGRSYPIGYDNYWLPENPNARYQKSSVTQSGSLRGSYYAQRNFIRLQDVTLSYSFDKQFLNRVKLQNLSVFVSGKNLITLTNWEGWDPETGDGITIEGRPVMKSFTIGLNIEF